jgi:hypothetical protein
LLPAQTELPIKRPRQNTAAKAIRAAVKIRLLLLFSLTVSACCQAKRTAPSDIYLMLEQIYFIRKISHKYACKSAYL